MTKTQKAELDAAIREWFSEHGPEAKELMEGSIARARDEQWMAENLKRLAADPPAPPPQPPPRVIATKAIGWERDRIEIGQILPKSHPAFSSVPDAFADVVEG